MKRAKPQNWNDQLRAADAGQNHYSILTGKPTPENWLNSVPPKRPRAPSVIPSEHSEQVTVIHFWRHACHTFKLPEFALFAVPNAGLRDPIQGAWLKAEGMRRGVPDLMLATRTQAYAGLFIELKRLDGRPSPEQQTIGAYLLNAGYAWKVCRGAGEAIEEIRWYLKT